MFSIDHTGEIVMGLLIAARAYFFVRSIAAINERFPSAAFELGCRLRRMKSGLQRIIGDPFVEARGDS